MFKKRWRKKQTYKKECVKVGVVGLVLILFLYLGSVHIGDYTMSQEKQLLEKAIKRAIVQCYAIEGMYPPNIEYIEEKYGLVIHDQYTVHYEIFASNMMPQIQVIEKSWEGE